MKKYNDKRVFKIIKNGKLTEVYEDDPALDIDKEIENCENYKKFADNFIKEQSDEIEIRKYQKYSWKSIVTMFVLFALSAVVLVFKTTLLVAGISAFLGFYGAGACIYNAHKIRKINESYKQIGYYEEHLKENEDKLKYLYEMKRNKEVNKKFEEIEKENKAKESNIVKEKNNSVKEQENELEL